MNTKQPYIQVSVDHQVFVIPAKYGTTIEQALKADKETSKAVNKGLYHGHSVTFVHKLD